MQCSVTVVLRAVKTGSESGAMATQEGTGDGPGGSEGSEDRKPDPLHLITSMLIHQAEKTDRLAREQAERAEAQTKRLEEIFSSSLAVVREESRTYTDQACEEVKDELLRGLEALRGEVQEAKSAADEARRAVMGTGGAGFSALPIQSLQLSTPPRLRSAFSEPMSLASLVGGGLYQGEPATWPHGVDDLDEKEAGGGGCPHAPASPLSAVTPPTTPPPHLSHTVPPDVPRVPARLPRSPPPSHDRRRCKPAEYDGKVAWEAYIAQFGMLARAQGWDEAEKALQLATALRGPALETLSHLPAAKQACFESLSEALQRRFGHRHQAEVYRAQLKKRVKQKSETLSQLAQDVEGLVRRSYPAAAEEMTTILARDAFVDALQDHQLQIYVKQAHPGDLQVALARAMEFEAFLKTSSHLADYSKPLGDVRGRRAKSERSAVSRESSPAEFGGRCWTCGEKGHRRDRCPRGRRLHSLDRPRSGGFQACCEDCGKSDHRSGTCSTPKRLVQAGNSSGLEEGATTQPAKVDTPRLV